MFNVQGQEIVKQTILVSFSDPNPKVVNPL